MSAAGGRARRALVIACAVALLACTGDDGPSGEGSSPDPVEGGTVRLALGGPVTTDPLEASLASPGDLMVLDLLHDGLTRLDADGRPQPAVAAAWTADAAQQTWRFELDPDATFTSGRAVTADDVVTSITRVAAAGDTSLAALALETVRGFRALAEGEADTLAGVTASDDATVEIVLDEPLSVLPEVLAAPVFGVVDPEALDPAGLDLSGAWAVAEGEGGALVATSRADAAVNTIAITPHPDPEAAYEVFDAGDADWALVPPDRFGEAVDAHGDAHFAPFHAELFFGMNVDDPALGNVFLRTAILLAVDREAIVGAVYADLASPLVGIVPAGVASHEAGECDVCDHDPERARELVEAAFPDGDVPTVAIDFDESAAQEQMAALVAADLEAAGIPTELRPLPLDAYKRFVVTGGQQVFSLGWIGVYASPDAYLAPLFVSDSDDNLTRFSSEVVDGLLTRARAGTDAGENAERWTTAERRVLNEAVVVPIAQFRTQALVADRVEGLAHAIDGTVDWREVTTADAR